MTIENGPSDATATAIRKPVPVADADDARRWALGRLELDKTKAPVDVAVLLRVLSASNYVLPVESVDASATVANSSIASPLAIQLGREQRLNEAVSRFARTFFDLTEVQQEIEWKSLCDDCKDIPSLALWLDQLKPGIGMVELPSSANEQVSELVKASCAAFLARPAGRIRQIQKLKREFVENEASCSAAGELQTLAPQFVEKIAPWISGESNSNKYQLNKIQSIHVPKISSVESRDERALKILGTIVLGVVMGVMNIVVKIPFNSSNSTHSDSVQIPKPDPNRLKWSIPKPGSSSPQNSFNRDPSRPLFDRLSPNVMRRMCAEIPGLNKALVNLETRAILDEYVLQLLPELEMEIESRYRQDVQPSPAPGKMESPPPLWLVRLRDIVR